MTYLPRRVLFGAGVALVAPGHRGRAEDNRWPALAAQIFENRPMRDGSAMLAIDGPYRAEDAAVVPLGIRLLREAGTPRIRSITVVIDENPSPLAVVFRPGAHAELSSISTRVRIDSYTNIHVVAEGTDGTLNVAQRFVKAAGGCSAPAAKHVAGDVPLGTMRFRQFPPPADVPDARDAQLMVRHPNYSGMQMDQLTRFYPPAQFVSTIRLWQGDELIVEIESGISISENPEYRFVFRAIGSGPFHAEAADNNGHTFHGEWAADVKPS